MRSCVSECTQGERERAESAESAESAKSVNQTFCSQEVVGAIGWAITDNKKRASVASCPAAAASTGDFFQEQFQIIVLFQQTCLE